MGSEQNVRTMLRIFNTEEEICLFVSCCVQLQCASHIRQ